MQQGQDLGRSGANASKRSAKTGSRSGSSGGSGGSRESRTTRMASEAASHIGEAAQQAGNQAAEAVSSLTALANEQVRRLADRQVSVGADLVAHVAEAIRAAADSLDQNVPQLSDTARGAAERIEGISDTIRDQSAAELLQTAADVARRRPSLLFGATALTGFVLYRLFSAGAAGEYDGEDDFDDFDDGRDDWESADQLEGGDIATAGETMTTGSTGGGQPYGG